MLDEPHVAPARQPDEPYVALTRQLLAAGGDVVTATDLKAAGVTTAQIARLVARGLLLRLRRDVLVDADRWRAMAPWQRHAPRALGVLRSLDQAGDRGLAVSHHSALSLHGVATHGVDDDAHLVRTAPGRGYRSTGLQVHAPVGPQHVMVVRGVRVVRPAVAIMQVASRSGVEPGLVAADDALREALCSSQDLQDLVDWRALRVGRSHAALVSRHADGRHESAGETRTRWALHLLGYRDVAPQVVIRTPAGEFVARVDFLLLDRVIVEFDGMTKYTDVATLRAEKRREDALRALGYQVVRITWADLDDLPALRRRLEAAIARAA